MRLPLAGIVAGVFAFSIVTVSFTACSSADPRPDAGSTDTASSSSSSSSSGGSSGIPDGGDEAGDAAGDASLPPSCSNTIKDATETDVDCGGTQCDRCIDGKACVQDNDCQGGSCQSNVCVTATCNDAVTNGDESDKDCGGTVCGKCQFGKRCTANSDCLSNTCVGTVCRCPKGMAEVSRAAQGGGTYCVDATEVTKADYNKFLTAGVPLTDQTAACSTNATFVPRGAWPPAAAPPYVNPSGLPFNLSLPVHYVDWCDAHAYCKWANKQLCGKINGGSIAPAFANDANEDAWYNACSQTGTKSFPYGTDFISSKCNGDGVGLPGPLPTNDGYGFSENQDDGVFVVINATDQLGNFTEYTHAECQGGAVGLYQMSGNVTEWEDSCDGAAADSKCNLRGGSYAAANDEAKLACNATRTETRLPPNDAQNNALLKDVGFRCCLY